MSKHAPRAGRANFEERSSCGTNADRRSLRNAASGRRSHFYRVSLNESRWPRHVLVIDARGLPVQGMRANAGCHDCWIAFPA